VLIAEKRTGKFHQVRLFSLKVANKATHEIKLPPETLYTCCKLQVYELNFAHAHKECKKENLHVNFMKKNVRKMEPYIRIITIESQQRSMLT